MASVRKRMLDSGLECWICDYFDQHGKRHQKAFPSRKLAVAWKDTAMHEVMQGTHSTGNDTVADAAGTWISFVRNEDLERSTIAMYEQHVRDHIVPRIGHRKLKELTRPRIVAFRNELVGAMSRALAKKVLGTFKSIVKDAATRGSVATDNAAGVQIEMSGRKPKLEVGRDIPTKAEIQKIVDHAATARRRVLLLTAALTGMRASELRGLRWSDVDLANRQISVRQRADRYRKIGQPKSAAGTRTIPIGDMVANTLCEWRLQCPKGLLDLVFPTGAGTIENHANIVNRILWPAQTAAGVVDDDGKPKYGMHALRHFYASWCINRKADGGLELPPKTVQARLGHASIVMTLDRYGHLFPTNDDGAELAAAERSIFAT
jgi:integrase